MTDFTITSPQDFVRQARFDKAIPGESFTQPVGSNPMERPPQIADAEEALVKTFESLSDKKNIRQMLNLLESNIPVDTLVSATLKSMVGEGIVSPQAAVVMVPAMTVMIVRMADAAGINFKMTLDEDDPVTIEEVEMQKLKEISLENVSDVNEQSSGELAALPTTEAGLMKEPKELI